MLLELLIAGSLATFRPEEPQITLTNEPQTEQILEAVPIPEPALPEPPPEPTLAEKIASNFYKCDEATQYIRADNAQCLPKPTNTPLRTQTRTTAPVRASQGTSGNYTAGQCTAWVAAKRYVPAGWGNASNWRNAAANAGWTVSTVPITGAIGWTSGHVVYVEAVHTNGTVTISEQNYNWIPFSTRTITVPTSKYLYLY